MSVQQRVRYHEYMRPRYSNPTYASSNIGATIGMVFNPSLGTKSQSIFVERQRSLPKVDPQENKITPEQSPKNQTKGLSRLSKYGTSSLKALNSGQFLPRALNERDVFDKQQKKYNIINMYPLSNGETIKKYPKFHLEHMDVNYFKKVQLEQEYNRLYNPLSQSDIYNGSGMKINPEMTISQLIPTDKIEQPKNKIQNKGE